MSDPFLPTVNITFARLFAGTTFFRSHIAAAAANTITIKAVNGTTKLTLTMRDLSELVETYEVAYTSPAASTGSVQTPQQIIDINVLRTLVNAKSRLVSMPIRGVDLKDLTGVDGDFIDDFTSNLIGGNGLPSTPSGIDTGPLHTMIHVNYDETGGSENVIYEWHNTPLAFKGEWKRR
jgi:hypothetical protein